MTDQEHYEKCKWLQHLYEMHHEYQVLLNSVSGKSPLYVHYQHSMQEYSRMIGDFMRTTERRANA